MQDNAISVTPEDMNALVNTDSEVRLKVLNVALQRMLAERDAQIVALNEQIASIQGNGDKGDIRATKELVGTKARD
jgi:hypothetical protein